MLAAGAVVVAFGIALVGFAVLVVVRRERAERFLDLFASSARAHYTEQVTRVVVGIALVIFSPAMWFAPVFRVFGWLVVASSTVLLLMPWRWHHRLGETAKPLLVRFLNLYTIGVFALGAFVLYGASRFVSH